MRTTDPELHKKRKLQIVEAASRCFVRKGFHQTSINDICKEVGLSPGGLYRYFDSKDEIIRAASDLETGWFLAEMKKIGPQDDIAKAIAKTAMIVIKSYNEPDEARFIAEVYAEAARNPNIGDSFAKNDAETKKALTHLLKTARIDGRISPALSPDETAEAIIALVDGYSTRILVDPRFKPRKVANIIRQIIEGLVRPKAQ